jgi:tetratricopeptide (TPR) repeat protein
VIAALLLAATAPGVESAALSTSDLRAEAEAAYSAGLESRTDAAKARPLFARAAAAYERLWQIGPRTPALARDLAQSYLLAGDLARAIRAYRLGLRLAPSDRVLRAGLDFARQQVAYPVIGNLVESARPRERRSLLHMAPAILFYAAAGGFYLLGCLGLARGWMTRRPFWWSAGGAGLILAAVLVGGTMWEAQRLADEDRRPFAVIVGGGAGLHKGNGDEFPLRKPERLPEGVELHLLTERGGWLQIQLAGGEIGWVARERVLLSGEEPTP